MNNPHLLVVAGSSRVGSLNLKLARFAASRAQALGAQVSTLDLRELALPLYDADLEAGSGVPPQIDRLQQALLGCDGVLLASPEYNGFPAPLVINAFDWLSRVRATPTRGAGLDATAGKPVALLAASPGAGGGLRGMNHLRQYLQMAFAMIVAPKQFALGRAADAFDAAGNLRDPASAQAVDGVVASLRRLAIALKAAPD